MTCKYHFPENLASQAAQTLKTVIEDKNIFQHEEKKYLPYYHYQKILKVILEQDNFKWRNEFFGLSDLINISNAEMLMVGKMLGENWRISVSEAQTGIEDLQEELETLKKISTMIENSEFYTNKIKKNLLLQFFYRGIIQGSGRISYFIQQIQKDSLRKKEKLYQGHRQDNITNLPRLNFWQSKYQGKRDLWLSYYQPLVYARSQETKNWIKRALACGASEQEMMDLLEEIGGHFYIQDSASIKWLWEGILTGKVSCLAPPAKREQPPQNSDPEIISCQIVPSIKVAFKKAISQAFAKISYQPIELDHTYPEVWNYYFAHEDEIDWQNNFFKRPVQTFFGKNAVFKQDFTYADLEKEINSNRGRFFDVSQLPE